MGAKDVAFLDQLLLRTKDHVERVNDAISRELGRYSGSRFYGPLVYALEGGKRIRPLILLFSAESIGSKDEGKLLDAAVAIELLHAESIIHDDIIDQEVTRRGKAAFHLQYGYSTSLLTADFVFAMILAIAARYQDRRVAETISNAALHMCEGEYAEVTIDPAVYRLGWEEYTEIIFNKTASLFQTAAKLGALIGGAASHQIEALSNYGKHVGIAYQIHDDTLDWGARDKITVALKQGSGSDSDSDEGSAVSRLKKLSETYAEKAKQQLKAIPDSHAKALLLDLTDFSVQRSY